MNDRLRLDELLAAQDGDAGCTAGESILDVYVELELAGKDPARVSRHHHPPPELSRFRSDHDGLLEAARSSSHQSRVTPDEETYVRVSAGSC